MEQYIYANVKREAYKMVSSSPDFFGNVRNAALMRHLINHDNHCPHGGLMPEAHQSFWMVTTDMDRPGEVPRLFVQASGGDPHRDGIYVQGYMCEVPDLNLYKNNMQDLLGLSFLSLEESLSAAEAGGLFSRSLEDLQKEVVSEMELPGEILKEILLKIFERKKVIIRIPAVGREAMAESRRLLLTIYNRLPYDYRASTGFITGSSLAALTNQQNPLPGAVNLVLLDGDADISSFRSKTTQALFDLKNPETISCSLSQEDNSFRSQLLNFLVNTQEESRRAFFDSALEYKGQNVRLQRMDINDFQPVYQMRIDMEGELSTQSIRHMAINIIANQKKWPAQFLTSYCKKLAEKMPEDRLLDHICQQIQSVTLLPNFGEADQQEFKNIQLDKTGALEVQDKNSGFVLNIAENYLLKEYPEGSRDFLIQGMIQRFSEAASQELPWTKEQWPTRETVQAANQFQMELPKSGNTMADRVKQTVITDLTQKRQAVNALYTENYRSQKEFGNAAIWSWPETPGASLQDLYDQLEKSCYLWEELFLDPQDGWKKQIFSRVQTFFAEGKPDTPEGFRAMQQAIQNALDFYSAKEPELFEGLQKNLLGRIRYCEKALELSQKSCANLAELVAAISDTAKLPLSPVYLRSLLKQWTEQVSLSPISWEEAEPLLPGLALAGANGEVRPYLQNLLGANAAFTVVPQDLKDDDAVFRLRQLEKLQQAGILSDNIFCEKLKQTGSASDLRQEYLKIRHKKPRTFFNLNLGERTQNNQYENLPNGENYVPVPEEDPRAKAGGGREKSGGHQPYYPGGYNPHAYSSGNNDFATPPRIKWCRMPSVPEFEPLTGRKTRGGAVAAGSILTGLIALFPAAALYLCDAGLLSSGITTGALGAMLLSLEIGSFAVRGRVRKSLMRFMGASLLPGMAGSTAILLLSWL